METQVTDETSPATDAATTEETPTEWTVMGYLAGDNNLNEEMVLTLQEILAAQGRQASQQQGEPEEQEDEEEEHLWPRVRIVAQLDPSGLGLPTQRYVFDTRDKPDEEKRYVKTYMIPVPDDFDFDADVNTGNPKALSGFVKWAVEETPDPGVTGSHMLILSGHGSGSTEDFLLKDEVPVDSLSIPELEEALDDVTSTLGKKVDILGMDCCFMSMVEVCYQIRDYVDHVVGAESMVPDFGWPYHRILAAAEDLRWSDEHGPVDSEELTDIIVRQFIEFYSDYDRTAGRSVDLAWIDLQGIGTLRDTMMELGDVLCEALDDPADLSRILLAHWQAQTYKFDQFVDIKDFCDMLMAGFGLSMTASESGNENTEVHPVSKKCSEVLTALDSCVRLSGCSGFAYQYSYGLSVYLPWAYVSDSYANLAFAKPASDSDEEVSGWMKFVMEYVGKTRRPVREQGDVKMEKIIPELEWIDSGYFEDAIDAISESLPPGQAKKHLKNLLKNRFRRYYSGDAGDLPSGSRYHKSRYHKSRYHKSRWPGDREKSVKNFTPVVGTAYWPPQQNG